MVKFKRMELDENENTEDGGRKELGYQEEGRKTSQKT